MAICNFYQRGACRFGDQCKNEHPGSQRDANRNTGSGFGGGSNTNRFGAFNGGDRYRPNQPSATFGNSRDAKTLPFHLDKADMKNDLTGQRPIYPLSSYGPGKDAPRQLIEGAVEISPDELRLRYYIQRDSGNEATAQQEESSLNEKMTQQVQAILNDIDGAVRYIEEGANVHPNRIDIANGGVAPDSANTSSNVTSNAFSQNPQPANPFLKAPSAPTTAFGQTSTPGFGQPAFGQASTPAQTTTAFGQASNPGQTTAGFGAPSALGQKPSPFSQPSTVGGAGAFGKPAFGSSGFGQPSMPGSGSAFGQSSALGQRPAFGQTSTPASASPFGQTSTPAAASPFAQASTASGQPSAFGKPAFGQSGFGQTSQMGAGASPFAQTGQATTSPFGQQSQQPTAQASPFGQQNPSSQQPNPFGQAQSQPAAGQANPFQAASSSSQGNPFGQTSQSSTGASPFGAQQSQDTTSQAANPFLQKPQTTPAAPTTGTSPFGAQSTQSASPFAQVAPQAQQPAAAGMQQNVQAGATKEIDPKDRFKEGKPELYEGEQGRLLEEIYRRVGQLGRFNDNEDIPLVPPKCEWIVQIPL